MSARTADRKGRAKWLAVWLLLLSSSTARARDSEDVKSWRLGEPPPVGYHVARKHTLGLVGGSMLAGGYAISVTYGLAFLGECHFLSGDGTSDPCDARRENQAAPFLFIPIVGPFLTFTNRDVRNDGGAVFWFSVFGAAQVAGAGLLAYDLAVPHYGLKRGDGPASRAAGPRLLVTSTYWGRGPGVALLGQF